jgi:hypothetical protein
LKTFSITWAGPTCVPAQGKPSISVHCTSGATSAIMAAMSSRAEAAWWSETIW